MTLRRWYMTAGLGRNGREVNWYSSPVDYQQGVFSETRSDTLPLDVEEKDDNLIITASVPGVNPEDIRVTTEDGVLTIESDGSLSKEEAGDRFLVRERTKGPFSRAITLPETIDVTGVNSEYDRGVLTISFPKEETKKAKRVEVKIRS